MTAWSAERPRTVSAVSHSHRTRRERGAAYASLALRALHAELVLAPKPGLVTPAGNGSHRDMNAGTFLRSMFSLRHYFAEIAAAGMDDAGFAELSQLGKAAETRMLRATNGINTHRGAIFTLGLLSAAAGFLDARCMSLTPQTLADTVRQRWGAAIGAAVPATGSNGAVAGRRYGVGGARAEGMFGFPSVMRIGLPVLDRALDNGLDARRAQIQTLFALIAAVPDTNLLHRGGLRGLRFAQSAAARFLACGGAFSPGWEQRAALIEAGFIARGLSPGGSADLLGATWYVHLLRSMSR